MAGLRVELDGRDAIAAALLAGVKLAIGFRHPQLGGQVGMATGTGDADADGDALLMRGLCVVDGLLYCDERGEST